MIPKVIRPFLWSNNLDEMDLQRDKKRIILNILNIGTKPATDWLFDFYPKSEIVKIIVEYGAKGELSEKSLNYWTLMLDIPFKKLTSKRLS
ncbi:MAG: hypothetical protein WCX23_00580 [Candidatus Paceibacterota bacterium]|jgi:hypothetical protein|nr:hypothetical protein [Candidatus Paceibacterota bacterium]MDD4831191.1 hypothetical protein [Candidatus Paceibacterota bacterium]